MAMVELAHASGRPSDEREALLLAAAGLSNTEWILEEVDDYPDYPGQTELVLRALSRQGSLPGSERIALREAASACTLTRRRWLR